jgi:hypothetical protein
MNLLYKRGQTDSISGKVTFTLWAQTELDDDEQHIVKRYKFDKAKLVDVFQPLLFRTAVSIGFIVSFALYALLWSMDSSLNAPISLVLGAGAAYFFYDRKRESVYVRDLIHGRNFACDSIVDLARKEAWVGTAVAILRQVMETAKHWDGTETVKIEPLTKAEAKFIALRGL